MHIHNVYPYLMVESVFDAEPDEMQLDVFRVVLWVGTVCSVLSTRYGWCDNSNNNWPAVPSRQRVTRIGSTLIQSARSVQCVCG